MPTRRCAVMRCPWISRTLEIYKIVIIQIVFLDIFLQIVAITLKDPSIYYKLLSIAATTHNFVVKVAFDYEFRSNIELINLNV